MKRQLIIGLICFELQDSSLSTQNPTFKQVDSGENSIVSDRTLYQVELVRTGLTAVCHEIEPRLIGTDKLADTQIRIVKQRLFELIDADHRPAGFFPFLLDMCPAHGLFVVARGIESLTEVGIRATWSK